MDAWRTAVERGDVRRGIDSLGGLERTACLFLGNGRAGACFDFLGSMGNEEAADAPGMIGMTALLTPWHITGGPFGMDYVLPIGRLLHRFGRLEPTRSGAQRVARYRQHLRLAEGVLETEIAWDEPGGRAVLRIEQFFPFQSEDAAGPVPGMVQRLTLREGPPLPCEVRFVPVRETGYHYGGRFRTDAPSFASERGTGWRIETDRVVAGVALLTDVSPGKRIPDGFGFLLERNRPVRIVLVAHGSPTVSDPPAQAQRDADRLLGAGWKAQLERHRAAWAEEWGQGWIDPGPDGFEPAVHALRTLYGLSSSVSPRTGDPPPLVCGLARAAWPSYFPQDFAYLYENAVLFGRRRRAEAMARWWPMHLEGARSYGRRLLGLKTAYYPWTAPILTWDETFHADGPPNRCYYEHHNQAFVARMLHLYCDRMDPGFVGTAYGVVRDLAETFRAMLSPEARTGRWGTRFRPTTSQDEAAPPDCENPFDLLIAAEYVLRLAARWAGELGADPSLRREWGKILDAGFALDRCARGEIYGVYAGDDRPAGSVKHPVQLNPIAFLPMPHRADDPRVVESWRRRYEIVAGVREGRCIAWTVGKLALASARMRDAAALSEDLDLARRCGLYDEEAVQWYESSGSAKSHFLTTPALVTHAVAETQVQDWRGTVEIDPLEGGSSRGWPRLAFAGLHLAAGWIATREDATGVVELTSPRRQRLRVRLLGGRWECHPEPDREDIVRRERVLEWDRIDHVVLRFPR